MKCQILFSWKNKKKKKGNNLHEMSNPVFLGKIKKLEMCPKDMDAPCLKNLNANC